jgi:zinc transport system substrate-binding protein
MPLIKQDSRWLATLLLLLSCIGAVRADTPQPQVVTSIQPLMLILAAVAGDRVEASVLLPADVSPHDFALRPSELRRLAGASHIFWIDPSMEHPLEAILSRLPGERRDTRLLPGVIAQSAAGPGPDPHIWLDPVLVARIAARMAQALEQAGLAEQAVMEDRVNAFGSAMQQTEAQIRQILDGLEQVPFIAMHDGYGHFVARFGLNQVATLSLDAEHQVGARAMMRLREQATNSGAVCLLRERASSRGLAATLTEGTALRVVELDSLAGSASGSADAFAVFLLDFARQIAACLRGDAPLNVESAP